MLVRDWMTKEPLIATPKTSVEEAIRIMRQNRVRHLPVVKKDGDTIVGIVTQTDLLQASPSPATSLSVWEINFLLAKMQVRDAMTEKVIVVEEECPLEEAALVMAEHKIGCLPVVRGRRLVGIITETDLFNLFTA
jgi:acetoin utilization protein AcuB